MWTLTFLVGDGGGAHKQFISSQNKNTHFLNIASFQKENWKNQDSEEKKEKGLNFWPNQTTPENPSKKGKLQKEKNPLEINKEKMNPLGTTYISCRWER